MKRWMLVATIALALVTAACSEQDEPVVKGSSPVVEGSIEGTITKTTIDGMDCLVWQNKKGHLDQAYAYSGITCDWSKYKGEE